MTGKRHTSETRRANLSAPLDRRAPAHRMRRTPAGRYEDQVDALRPPRPRVSGGPTLDRRPAPPERAALGTRPLPTTTVSHDDSALLQKASMLQEALDGAERLFGAVAYRGFDLLTTHRPKNVSGNFRGMVKSKNFSNAAKAAKFLQVAVGVPGAIAETKEGVTEARAILADPALTPGQKVWEVSKTGASTVVDAGCELTGLTEAKNDIVGALKKVDEIGADPTLNPLESTWEFAKVITKGGVKTFLDAFVPFGGLLSEKIEY